MKRKTKVYLSAPRALLATAACAGLALGLVSARATVVAPLQLPGHGDVIAGGATGSYGNTGGGTITVTASNTVINWGNSGGTIGTNQPGGFNIGGSANLTIATGGNSLLNVDVTGSPSQILGTMGVTGNAPVFVANANGITVGPNATITSSAGLGLIAATVNAAQFASNGTIPVSFVQGGNLTVQGNLQGVGGFVLLAGSGAVNVSPIPTASGAYFKIKTSNVTVVGGVGGTVSATPSTAPTYTASDAAGSPTPSASGPTTVTLNLGTSANPYNMTGLTVLANGNMVNNGVLGGLSGYPNALISNGNGGQPTLQWTGTLTNNGTIKSSLASGASLGRVNFYGNTSAPLAYGGLVNNGTIAINFSTTPLFVQLPGTIINNAGATISNTGGVELWAGNVSLPLFTGVGGAVINHGTIAASGLISLVVLKASNPNHVGPNPGGGVFSDGSIIFGREAELVVASLTGNAFLGGSVTTPNGAGLASVFFQSGPNPANLFTLGTNVMANYTQFNGGSLTGPGTLTTANLDLNDFTGNVNNVTSPTNYLANGFHLSNGSFGNTNITISLPTTSQGAVGRQVVNLNVAGNARINSGITSTFQSGSGPIAMLPTEANVDSNLLVQASGNLTVSPSSPPGPANYAFSSGALHTDGFVFPGGIVLIAGSTLTLNTVVDNGYAPTVVAGQGIFFQAPTITVASGVSVITNGNAWVNFCTPPSTVPTIYGVARVSATTFKIVLDPSAFHIRCF
ncbi:filamentous hemagglutinin N-terminal domain-containing protein [Methylacidimicrobium sp. B4]|uniref:beta strand repeat-containing protein n=1 Tax=Methylacidimicrobium sp. B4 TaxID=2796139 RepID=UPI001A8ECA17|nr:filamentous hemagglutinin N-terminal domain-containing protein [Methylacidimicrobium sp. B4]QSR84717.1 filamentous hemagglutinin N-terminal domain-containing protein [Methylacidimicrobium sp. B4]